MRLTEVLILVVDLLAITRALALLPPGVSSRWVEAVPLVAGVLVIPHLILEGYRWQMVPAYALTAGLCGVSLWRLAHLKPRPGAPGRARASLRSGLGALLIVVIALPPVFVPVPVTPDPGGPYAIGTLAFDWVDASRDEIYAPGPAPAGKREIMVQVWYPAFPAPGAQTGPWMDRLDVVGPAIATYLHLPPFLLDHAALVRTHSYPNAQVSNAQARYPVVIYSHGWNGFRTINTNQLEALASRGYVAVSIDHTYGALVTVFGDGRVALNNPKALPQGSPPAEYQQASETLEGVYAADLGFVLDQLKRLDIGEMDQRLAGRLDLERIGLFGHSTGGGAVVLACSRDPRCKAGLGMDAWVVPVPDAVIAGGLGQPFLFMRSEVWATDRNNARLDRLYSGLKLGGYRMTIRGTRHYDFVMLGMLTPLAPALGLKGPIEGYRGMQVITDYLVAFFDQTLKGRPSSLLDGPSRQYPEVVLERRVP